MKPVLEVCTHSVESAVSAERGGAMRLELCANLMIGGTSPDEDLFRMVRERVSVPVRVLLRPRCGDFLYTESEFELLCRQVKRFAALGADGIVIGVLTPEGDLDEERMAKLISLAGGCGVTLHRAFDVCRDPFAALETAKRLGGYHPHFGSAGALHRGCTAAARAGRKSRGARADSGRCRRKRRCYTRFAAENRRECLPSFRKAGGKQQNAVPARKCADGAARTERIQFVAVRRKCSPCGA